ncbi:MAG: hypothetical protein HC837_12065 [Chloroflexaceae bacterium]|nr:hypothetical protein [Chloroflexaceae bacterium]
MKRQGIVILVAVLVLGVAAAGGIFFFLSNQDATGGTDTPSGNNQDTGTGQGQTDTGPPPTPTQEQTVEILIARIDIPANTLIDSDSIDPESESYLFETDEIPISRYNQQSGELITDLRELRGKVTTRLIQASDQIERGAFTDPGLAERIPQDDGEGLPRSKAYPILVNRLTGVSDLIKQGDFVDVLVTFSFPRDDNNPLAPGRVQAFPLLRSTKTVVQQAEVLDILYPPPQPAAEGETPAAQSPGQQRQTGAQAGPPPPPGTATEGGEEGSEEGAETPATPQQTTQAQVNAPQATFEWIVILAVDDQEAELLEFAKMEEAQITLVLRGSGDDEFEPTIGVTMDLMISEFGLPEPEIVDINAPGE